MLAPSESILDGSTSCSGIKLSPFYSEQVQFLSSLIRGGPNIVLGKHFVFYDIYSRPLRPTPALQLSFNSF